MISRVCICCGEPFSYEANEAVHNPNICLACSKMADDARQQAESELSDQGPDRVDCFHRSAELQNAS